jgi:CO/xanthine dehydrogenase Mo-binding subunit
MLMASCVGDRIPRIDAAAQVSGEVVYGDDLARGGMIFGKVLHSPHAHARILSIDTSFAQSFPGVFSVITAKDIPNNIWGFSHFDQPVLCENKVCYYGDPVAAVAAESPQVAEEALRLIKVTYEPLPAVFDPVEAMGENAPRVHEHGNVACRMKIRHGDIEKGWQESETIIEEEFYTQRVQHCHLEPHTMLVVPGQAGALVVYTSSQRVFRIKKDLCSILGLSEDKITVFSPPVGGGFGAKTEITMEPLACIFAQRTGHPVKMNFSREEEFTTAPIRHPLVARYKSGVAKDGHIVARKVELIFDTGAYVSQGQSVLAKASINCVGPYEVPNVWIDGCLVYTNTNFGSAMRGFGVPQIAFAYESHTETLAHSIGMDSLEFRKLNFLKAGSVLPTGQILEKPLAFETLEAAQKLAKDMAKEKV